MRWWEYVTKKHLSEIEKVQNTVPWIVYLWHFIYKFRQMYEEAVEMDACFTFSYLLLFWNQAVPSSILQKTPWLIKINQGVTSTRYHLALYSCGIVTVPDAISYSVQIQNLRTTLWGLPAAFHPAAALFEETGSLASVPCLSCTSVLWSFFQNWSWK